MVIVTYGEKHIVTTDNIAIAEELVRIDGVEPWKDNYTDNWRFKFEVSKLDQICKIVDLSKKTNFFKTLWRTVVKK